MSGAAKKEKVVSAKGDEAEEIVSRVYPQAGRRSRTTPQLTFTVWRKVLGYLNAQNRPYGATDLSANLKNRVSKAQAAKTLAALHDKGEILGKAYGKTTVYCALQVRQAGRSRSLNGRLKMRREQKDTDALSAEDLVQVEDEIKALKDEQQDLKEHLKALSAQKSAFAAQPRTAELASQIAVAKERTALLSAHLATICDSSFSSLPSEPSTLPTDTPSPSVTLPGQITQASLDVLAASHESTLSILLNRRKIVKEIEGILMEMLDKRKGEEEAVWETVGADSEVKVMDARVMKDVAEIK
ncbi:26S proteasome regulatory subunit, ATPase 3, interacting protein, partial [Phenoliferia sp. Uapishka_3]